jgi:hypothetical protein
MLLTPPGQCLAAAAAYTYQLMKLILLLAAAAYALESLLHWRLHALCRCVCTALSCKFV